MGRAALAIATKQMELRQPESRPSPHLAPRSHWFHVLSITLTYPVWVSKSGPGDDQTLHSLFPDEDMDEDKVVFWSSVLISSPA